jgi:hypothetical protein
VGFRFGNGEKVPATPDDAWREPTNRAVDQLVEYARALVGARAIVERRSVGGGLPTLWIEPVNPRARSVWIVGEQWLIVQLGEQGGRWELGYEDSDVALAKGLIAAAHAGRVTERVAFARSRVTVTLDDGETLSETGYDGCLGGLVPLPGWPRWGREIVYEPYATGSSES